MTEFRRSVAAREIWRAQRVAAAVGAAEAFLGKKNYKALWELRARLTQLLEARDRFLWAALDTHNKVLATSTSRADVVAAAKEQGVKNPVVWFVASTEVHSDGPLVDLTSSDGMVRAQRRCRKCWRPLPCAHTKNG